jgi:hypothetical protein
MAADHSEFDPLASFPATTTAYATPNVNTNNTPGRDVAAFDPFGSLVEGSDAETSNSNDNINAANVNRRPGNANSAASSVAMSPSPATQPDPFADLYSSSRANNQQPVDVSGDDTALDASASTTASATAPESRVSPASIGVPAAGETAAVVNEPSSLALEASTAPVPVPVEDSPTAPLQQSQFNFQVCAQPLHKVTFVTSRSACMQAFLAKMRQQKAFDLVKQIKGFIGKFSTPVLNPDEAAPLIRQFLDTMCNEVCLCLLE